MSNGPAVPVDVDIRGLTADSREVRPGFLFAALQGSHHDGAEFIADAVGNGAVAVLGPLGLHARLPESGVQLLCDPNPRRRLALMSARFFAAQPHVIAAVTGTNGKTSVAAFTRQIWEVMGYPAAALGTLGLVVAGTTRPLAHTTPDPVALHRLLAQLAASGVDHLAIEASSHGLDQYRIDGVRVGVAAFTNLSHEHLDYHQSIDAYLAAKLRLFDEVMEPGGTAVLNADSDAFDRLRDVCRARRHRVLSFGRGPSDLRLIDRVDTREGQTLVIDHQGRGHEVALPLIGEFQALNALCAAGLVVASGGDAEAALSALSRLEPVPGRVELVGRHPSGAPIYVDYAHKPEALAHVLRALRPLAAGRLVVVFGCGGDRDREKRGIMGEVAASLADRVIVTDDNPRSEDPAAIRRAIMAACPGATEIGDRAIAIASAVAELESDDVLVIAGKGHEHEQIVGDRKIDFDDAEAARAAVSALRGSNS